MSNPIITGDVLLVEPVCTFGVQTALNATHFRCDSHVGTGATDNEIADYFEAALASLYKAAMTDTAAWYGLLVQKIFPLPPYAHQVSRVHAGAGIAGNTPASPELCGLIAAKTPLAGRAFQGRSYIPFLDANEVQADGIHGTNTYVTRLLAISGVIYIPQTVVGGSGSSVLKPVLYHRQGNIAGTTTPNSTTDISAVDAEQLLAVQRRRGPRGRANPPPV
jgi:hypothetical protein